MSTSTRITRLAPSPTGALHLGNAQTFLINWALARQKGWAIALRIEDLDTPRTKSGADQQAIDDLQWLGIDWDTGPSYQLANLAPYESALDRLRDMDLIYPCSCSRRDIQEAASAPHDQNERRYPGTCRPPADPAFGAGQPQALRLKVPDAAIEFDDALRGVQRINPQQQVGDFVVRTKAGLPAYQLAVVLDDVAAGITDVVRGDDLIDSTARQIVLYHQLDLGPVPTYWHTPLVRGEDGRRLAKRHGDTRLASFRTMGVDAVRVIGLVAHLLGMTDEPVELTAVEFTQQLNPTRLPPGSVTLRSSHVAWLCRK
jgi:glutamyl-tRNA synthetase